jgi:hypothetical protein
MNNFCQSYAFKIHKFKVKSTFEPNVFKSAIKKIISISHFAFLIINVKTFSNF